MARTSLDPSVTSLLDFYRNEHRIFGRCPHCDEIFRLSEVKLTYGTQPPKDLLSEMKRERDRLRDKLEELESDIDDLSQTHDDELSELRQTHSFEIDALNQKWTDRVDTATERAIQKRTTEIRRAAVARSRVTQLGKTLEKIAPMFPGFGHLPYDVRPIFDPIDFVIFDGYSHGAVSHITFVEFKTGQSRVSDIQESIRETVDRKRVSFELKRLSKDSLRRLTSGRKSKNHQFVE